jgi:glutamyl-tRNA synthetase
VPYLERAGLDPAAGPAPGAVAALVRDRVATLAEMADAAHYFYKAPHPTPEQLAAAAEEATRPALTELAAEFSTVEWSRAALGAALKAAAARQGLKPAQVMMAMRMLLCGTRETPAIDAVLALLGRETVRTRLAGALAAQA